MIKAVVFDIDGTLTPEISWTLLTQGLGASLEDHKLIFGKYLGKKLSYKNTKQQILSLWTKTGNANREFIVNLVKSWVIYPDAWDVVNYLKAKKVQLCLITGSFDLYAKSVADRLEIADCYANGKLIWGSREELVDFNFRGNQAKVKLRHFQTFCQKYKLGENDCVVVGDSDNDIELFKHTKRGISVYSPTSHFLREYSWKSIRGLTELMEII